MSSREQCPDCGSLTALGTLICFKCGRHNNNFFRTKENEVFETHIKLPEDVTFIVSHFPPAALQWLYKAGVYDEDIKRQHIGYVPSSGRVLVPAIDEFNNIMFYQLRDVTENATVRYLTVGESSKYVIKYIDHESSFCIVLVEDHLSAIRLRRNYNVVCLSGTSIPHKELSYIVNSFNQIVFWLDADRAGQIATNKIYKQFKSLSDQMSVRNLFLHKQEHMYMYRFVDAERIDKDPKEYTDSQIKDAIENKTILLK